MRGCTNNLTTGSSQEPPNNLGNCSSSSQSASSSSGSRNNNRKEKVLLPLHVPVVVEERGICEAIEAQLSHLGKGSVHKLLLALKVHLELFS